MLFEGTPGKSPSTKTPENKLNNHRRYRRQRLLNHDFSVIPETKKQYAKQDAQYCGSHFLALVGNLFPDVAGIFFLDFGIKKAQTEDAF
jgi:hypothetical protein